MFGDSFSQSLEANPSPIYEKPLKHGQRVVSFTQIRVYRERFLFKDSSRLGMRWEGIATSTILMNFEFPFLWDENPAVRAVCNACGKLWSAFGDGQAVPLSVGARSPVPRRVFSKDSL